MRSGLALNDALPNVANASPLLRIGKKNMIMSVITYVTEGIPPLVVYWAPADGTVTGFRLRIKYNKP